MEYLKCLLDGMIGMVVAVLVWGAAYGVAGLGLAVIELFLSSFGAQIDRPTGVSRSTIATPIAWILWGFIVLPCIGSFVHYCNDLSKKVKLLVFQNVLLEKQAADLREELASKKTTA